METKPKLELQPKEFCKPFEHDMQFDGIIDGVEYHKCTKCPRTRQQFHDVGSGC